MTNAEIGERLRDLRKEKGISIYSLGKLMNVAPSTISTIERGEQGVTVANAILFSKIYNVQLEYIVGVSDDKQKKETLDSFVSLTASQLQIFKKIKKMNDEDIKKLNIIIDTMFEL